ncbi:uncharacterized protein PAC_06149 [Phialocephala subalpina]|uniref:Uncharacterized protein n=1 Tax=Phialocephala subalpina TaxID=576137 RepID=A0A1L7WU09_9HELO|nr:uncharacterized protein PAC_06149 [Phialocephala subalpina]
MSPRDSRSSPDSQSSATSKFPRQDDGKNQDREKPVPAALATIAGIPETLQQGHNEVRRWWWRKAERSAISSPKRPHTSVDQKPRPTSKSKSKRLWKTSGEERRSSMQRNQFPSIPGYPEDREIIRFFVDLTTSISQHVERYYPNASPSIQGRTSLDDLQTQHVLIRKYISQKIIESTVMQSLTNKSAIAKEISRQLASCANPNENDIRRAEIERLSELGGKLGGLIKSHHSFWEFGSWETDQGFITIFPALLKDGEPLTVSRLDSQNGGSPVAYSGADFLAHIVLESRKKLDSQTRDTYLVEYLRHF